MNVFCYIIAGYDPGNSILIRREGGEVGISIGDWHGNRMDKAAQPILEQMGLKLIEVMRLIRIPQAQFYFSADNKLVDVQISINKFLGPGMLRDLFGKLVQVQTIIEMANMTPEKVVDIKAKPDVYGKRVTIKPNRYRYIDKDGKITPLYAIIVG